MSEALNVVDLVDLDSTAGNAEFAEATALAVKHFRLRENPFVDSVNPQFFYRTEAHEEAFIRMRKCIDEHVAVGLTTALSGTGKTLLTQILLNELDPARHEPILVLAYPGMKRQGLLRDIAGELGIELYQRATLHQVITSIQNAIVALHRAGRKLVIIIDECHFLGVDALQMVRTLSNLELPDRKLVTILLFGEESFLEKMGKPEYASIFNRMFVRARLRPLTETETQQYVKFRCLLSGGRPNMFRDDFFPVLQKMSNGIPREVNRLCHTALFNAARQGATEVSASLLDGES
ncbi:MAG: ExeA family protein [Candidatus Sumerlaeaceae bacterium]